jgi:prepilin-type N-terminal cleavage/methylation domain-containing protein
MKQISPKQLGFTFIELVVVVAIIAVLATLVVSSVQKVRINGRDAQRVNDINQIRSALSMYYAKYSQYPTYVTTGQTFMVNDLIYLKTVPTNPMPRGDAACNALTWDTSTDYVYTQTDSGRSYTLSFCLGYRQDTIPAGRNKAIPEGIVPY